MTTMARMVGYYSECLWFMTQMGQVTFLRMPLSVPLKRSFLWFYDHFQNNPIRIYFNYKTINLYTNYTIHIAQQQNLKTEYVVKYSNLGWRTLCGSRKSSEFGSGVFLKTWLVLTILRLIRIEKRDIHIILRLYTAFSFDNTAIILCSSPNMLLNMHGWSSEMIAKDLGSDKKWLKIVGQVTLNNYWFYIL